MIQVEKKVNQSLPGFKLAMVSANSVIIKDHLVLDDKWNVMLTDPGFRTTFPFPDIEQNSEI